MQTGNKIPIYTSMYVYNNVRKHCTYYLLYIYEQTDSKKCMLYVN